MAKNKENKQETKPAVTNQSYTVDNVMDEVRRGNLMTQALTEQVLEDIKKEKDERKANDLKERILKASYRRVRALIQLRARRRESDITKEKLQRSELLEDQLAGFKLTEDKLKKHGGKDGKLTVGESVYTLEEGKEVWVPATKTVVEYDDEAREISNDIRKKMSESDKTLQKDIEELRKQYPGWWRYDWDD